MLDPLRSSVRLGEYALAGDVDPEDMLDGGMPVDCCDCCCQGPAPGGDNDCGITCFTMRGAIRDTKKQC